MRIWQVIKSVLASFFGVQTHKNYEHDFTQSSSILPFIVVGVFMLVLLIASIMLVVKLLV
uniref:DUF2970 domain-containing protein n=1 Tax=Ningiella ruwaisensis TaxID=2364274 RepID=UPI0010A00A75|nr:DUF2970 domain-containing protein [Ningiella ruwaisensis]